MLGENGGESHDIYKYRTGGLSSETFSHTIYANKSPLTSKANSYIMGMSRGTTCTNSINVSSHADTPPDERTPLLSGTADPSRSTKACDPEAVVCPSPIEDKNRTVDSSNNVTGVISILLLGTFTPNHSLHSPSFSKNTKLHN